MLAKKGVVDEGQEVGVSPRGCRRTGCRGPKTSTCEPTVGQQGPGAQPDKGTGPGGRRLPEVEPIIEAAQEQQGEAAGIEDVGAGPEVLVDGEGQAPKPAGGDADDAEQ